MESFIILNDSNKLLEPISYATLRFTIDDSPTDIELTKIALETAGREIGIRAATDGKSALAMLRNGLGVPPLILLDIKMPGMDSIEVLREIRAEDSLKELPIVVLTSSALESDRTDAIAGYRISF